MLAFDCTKVSDSAADIGANLLCVGFVDFKLRIANRFFGGRNRILTERAHPSDISFFNELKRIETFDFGSKTRGEAGRIKFGNRSCAALTLQKCCPRGRNIITYRCNKPQACYYHAAFEHIYPLKTRLLKPK